MAWIGKFKGEKMNKLTKKTLLLCLTFIMSVFLLSPFMTREKVSADDWDGYEIGVSAYENSKNGKYIKNDELNKDVLSLFEINLGPKVIFRGKICRDFNVTPWITNLPQGLKAEGILEDKHNMLITVTGNTHEKIAGVALELTVPEKYNTSKKPLTLEINDRTIFYDINMQDQKAYIGFDRRENEKIKNISDGSVLGSFSVNLKEGKFLSQNITDDISHWVEGLPEGLKCTGEIIYDNKIQVTVSGISKTTLKNQPVVLNIPAEATDHKVKINTLSNRDVKFNVENRSKLSVLTSYEGMKLKPVVTNQKNNGKVRGSFVIKIENGKFIGKNRMNLSSWIKNLPKGLKAVGTMKNSEIILVSITGKTKEERFLNPLVIEVPKNVTSDNRGATIKNVKGLYFNININKIK